jgi:hypothetical protein
MGSDYWGLFAHVVGSVIRLSTLIIEENVCL